MLVLRQNLEQSQELTQKLSQEQRFILHQRLFVINLELIQSLRNEKYEPEGACEKCGRILSPIEIIDGFNDDPNDFTTRCTNCGHRFEPELICSGDGWKIRVSFYCNIQTLKKLEALSNLSPEEIAKKDPGSYRSAIVHYGGLKNAFAKIEVDYPFEEIHDWKAKIGPFLGKLPDIQIARASNVPVSKIRSARKKLGVPRFTIKNALDDEE